MRTTCVIVAIAVASSTIAIAAAKETVGSGDVLLFAGNAGILLIFVPCTGDIDGSLSLMLSIHCFAIYMSPSARYKYISKERIGIEQTYKYIFIDIYKYKRNDKGSIE